MSDVGKTRLITDLDIDALCDRLEYSMLYAGLTDDQAHNVANAVDALRHSLHELDAVALGRKDDAHL